MKMSQTSELIKIKIYRYKLKKAFKNSTDIELLICMDVLENEIKTRKQKNETK